MLIWIPNWLPLALMVLGILALVKAWHMGRTSSFHDGTFATEMKLMIGGGVSAVVGVLWFGALLFMGQL